MATFMSQIQALTNLSSDATTQGYVTQWLNDGAIEIINSVPRNKLIDFSTQSSFTPVAAGSESEPISDTSKILNVYRTHGSSSIDIECRRINPSDKHKANDEDEILYATEDDPVYYIENGFINTLPKSSTSKYNIVTYPQNLTYDDSSIGGNSYIATGVTATAADPTVFTKSSHSFSTGDKVRCSEFVQMTEINGLEGTITKLDGNTFEINGVAADSAETTGGKITRVTGNYPEEYYYLVVLYASIKATEYLLATEEDAELYNPVIGTLKQDYSVALNRINPSPPQPQGRR